MHSHQTQVVLLILSFILSLFLFVASAKYAEWARVMVSGQPSGSWLGLVFYIGSIPLLSLFFNTIHLIAFHFDLLRPQFSPSAFTSNPSLSDPNQTGYPIDPTIYLLALLTSIAQTIMWLGQSSLCTACELAPILAGTQGLVPGWCPQSNFHDTGRSDLPDMLGQLAIVKDIISWVMVPLSCALVECARRQWARARLASVTAANLDPGLREYDWKSGVTVAIKEENSGGRFELRPVPGPSKPLPIEPGVVEIGLSPSRPGALDRNGVQGVPVRSGLDVGASYESRI